MNNERYSPEDLLDVGNEELSERGFWMVTHVGDPGFTLPGEVRP